jgi:hypothetical protein
MRNPIAVSGMLCRIQYYNGCQFFVTRARSVVRWQGTEPPVFFGESYTGGCRVSR